MSMTALTAPGMTREQWFDYLVIGGTRNVRSRCCGRIIFYVSPGDELCPQHRCSVITRWGEQCSRRASMADECSQHFSQNLRKISQTPSV